MLWSRTNATRRPSGEDSPRGEACPLAVFLAGGVVVVARDDRAPPAVGRGLAPGRVLPAPVPAPPPLRPVRVRRGLLGRFLGGAGLRVEPPGFAAGLEEDRAVV